MKKLLLILTSMCLLFTLAACDISIEDLEALAGVTAPAELGGADLDLPSAITTDAVDKNEETATEKQSFNAMAKNDWMDMIDDSVFENYTCMMEGVMTVTQNGANEGTTAVKEMIRVTEEKMASDIYADGEYVETIVVDGDTAAAQKEQSAQIFKTLLAEYDSFSYDAQTNTYKVTATVKIETVLKSLTYDLESGQMVTADVPAVIEMHEAELTLTEDGKLSTFVCDYSQTMTMVAGFSVTTSGRVTWNFSDFGTTVID